MYRAEYVEKPCRNFAILGNVPFIDPKDGLEKFAAVSTAAFANGVLYLVEPRSNAVEQYTLPMDFGGWALYNYNNEALIIGTSERYGCIHRFDLKTRTFAEPLLSGEPTYMAYVWNFAADGEGYLYGGTYCHAKLLRYDLANHKLEDLGKVDDNPKNTYNRLVAYYEGYILCDVGMAEPCTYAYRISDGTICKAADVGITVKAGDVLNSTDPRTNGRSPCIFSDGSLVVIDGQEYRFYEGDSTEPVIRLLPGDPPATVLFALVNAGDGLLYGTSSLGMTFFSYDTKTGAYWNSAKADCTCGGEIYGLAVKDGKLYMTNYTGGNHLEYDPTKPWDSRNAVNPRNLGTVGPDGFIRPHGRTVIGPRGDIWTGWYAKYGAYGGALSKLETETGKVTCYPVGENAVASITTDGTYVYYVTFGAACGLPYRMQTFKLAAVDADGNEVRAIDLPEGTKPELILAVGKKLFISCHDVIQVYCKDTFALICEIPTPGVYARTMICFGDRVIAFVTSKEVLAIDPETHVSEVIAEVPNQVCSAAVMDDTLYFGCATELWKLTKE